MGGQENDKRQPMADQLQASLFFFPVETLCNLEISHVETFVIRGPIVFVIRQIWGRLYESPVESLSFDFEEHTMLRLCSV